MGRFVPFERLAEVPPFSEDAERGPAPGAVRALRQELKAADAVLIATPEYNHSLPGQLKNALDWASRPAQAELRKVLAAMGGRVVEAELPVARAHELLVGDRLEPEPQQAEAWRRSSPCDNIRCVGNTFDASMVDRLPLCYVSVGLSAGCRQSSRGEPQSRQGSDLQPRACSGQDR
jgi:NADPH-dependent FMN reductase